MQLCGRLSGEVHQAAQENFSNKGRWLTGNVAVWRYSNAQEVKMLTWKCYMELFTGKQKGRNQIIKTLKVSPTFFSPSSCSMQYCSMQYCTSIITRYYKVRNFCNYQVSGWHNPSPIPYALQARPHHVQALWFYNWEGTVFLCCFWDHSAQPHKTNSANSFHNNPTGQEPTRLESQCCCPFSNARRDLGVHPEANGNRKLQHIRQAPTELPHGQVQCLPNLGAPEPTSLVVNATITDGHCTLAEGSRSKGELQPTGQWVKKAGLIFACLQIAAAHHPGELTQFGKCQAAA